MVDSPSSTSSASLSSLFGSTVLSNPPLLTELTSLSRIYHVSPQDLFYKWEAFYLNNLLQSKSTSAAAAPSGSAEALNLDNLKLFRSSLHRESERDKKMARSSNGNPPASTPVKRENPSFGTAASSHRKINTPSLGNLLGLNPSTPSSKPKPRSSISSNFATPSIPASASRSKLNGPSSSYPGHSTGGPFSSSTTSSLNETPTRPSYGSMDVDLEPLSNVNSSPIGNGSSSSLDPSSGTILETLNPGLKPFEKNVMANGKSRVKLAVNRDPKTWNYRYMFEKEAVKSQVFDEKIDELSEVIRVHYGIGMAIRQEEEEDQEKEKQKSDGDIDVDVDEEEKKSKMKAKVEKEKEEEKERVRIGRNFYSHLELGDPSRPSQQDMIVVGRICVDLTIASTKDKNQTKDLTSEKELQPNPEDDEEEEDEILDSDGQPLRSTKPSKANTDLMPHLSEQNLLLESSRMLGAGSLVPLVFNPNCRIKLGPNDDGEDFGLEKGSKSKTQLGFYPGMIAGFRGKNGGGDKFTVDEILLPPPLPHSATPKSEMMDLHYSKSKLDGKPMKFLTASGPYTGDEDLRFEPWHRLMDGLEKEGADVVLLLGPFLSRKHRSLAAEEISTLPSEIFASQISSRLTRFLSVSPRTTLILIPSTLDMLCAHSAWPQPMLEKEALKIPKKVKCLPNPCIFSINEVVVAASTADVLKDFKKEEIVKMFRIGSGQAEAKVKVVDPMDRFCRQVLSQRSLYPIYPASKASGLSISTTHLHLSSFYPVSPDLLILPSSLKPFARIVDSTVCVNPGLISKDSATSETLTSVGDSEGAWARIGVECFEKQKLEFKDEVEEMEPVNHDCWERTRVEIVRL